MLNLGTIELPVSAATRTFAILAKRGAGKSYTAGVMQEEMYKNNIPFVTFDPIDVHWGLRVSKDKTGKGLPIVVFGVLDNADIPLNDEMGAEIARAVVDTNISCVISTFGMSKKGQRRLIAEFSEELLKINNTPRHIFIEEAHEYVPQRVGSDIARCYSAVEALVVMGRNRGLGVTLINQRAATINKDVLTQIDTLLAFRNVSPQDRKALREWVEVHAETADFDKFWSSLPSLPTGEGWIWSPEWLEKFERIKIRERETLHPDRENVSFTTKMLPDKAEDIARFVKAFISNRQTKKELKDDRIHLKRSDILPLEGEFISKEKYDADMEERNKVIADLQRKFDEQGRIITLAKKVLSGEGIENSPLNQSNSATIEMWLDKIGRSNSAGKMLQLLHQKNGLKLTRHQIRTLLGISAKSSGFSTAVRLLVRNRLIIEQGDYLVINPEL
jgi:hypothetical protein